MLTPRPYLPCFEQDTYSTYAHSSDFKHDKHFKKADSSKRPRIIKIYVASELQSLNLSDFVWKSVFANNATKRDVKNCRS